MNLMTFDDVMADVKVPHLLVGNGFSIAYDSKRFSFTTLLESAVHDGIIDANSEIYKVFVRLETSDFESVMKAMENSADILDVYSEDKEVMNRIL